MDRKVSCITNESGESLKFFNWIWTDWAGKFVDVYFTKLTFQRGYHSSGAIVIYLPLFPQSSI